MHILFPSQRTILPNTAVLARRAILRTTSPPSSGRHPNVVDAIARLAITTNKSPHEGSPSDLAAALACGPCFARPMPLYFPAVVDPSAKNSLDERRELHRRPGPFRARCSVAVAAVVVFVVAIAPRPIVRARAVRVAFGRSAFLSLAATASATAAVAIAAACVTSVAFPINGTTVTTKRQPQHHGE